MFCDTSKYNQFFKQYVLFSIFVNVSKQHWFSVSLSPPQFLKEMQRQCLEFICTTIENELVEKTLLQNQPNTTTFIYWRTNTSCQYFLGKIYNICQNRVFIEGDGGSPFYDLFHNLFLRMASLKSQMCTFLVYQVFKQ